MAESINVRLPEKLKDFINRQIGLDGLYESASEYIRDLIRKDYEIQEKNNWDYLYEELKDGINANENQFIEFNPDEIIAQAKKENY
ncbi:MAG TPA: type II toxin-antitoxin system ParD family antitoxin [Candidatus Gastranaerophilales bacterium]|nr:type II toxin-antitoxin system ParD family antitoxin [Candidatus Gastranaerophilales bacterium]